MAGMTGDEIYRNFMDGYGSKGLDGIASVMKTLADTYGERADQIHRLVGRMEAAWQGEAAGSARRGAGPLAVEHDMSSAALRTAQDLTGRQAGSFDEAKSRVVPVPPKPELLNPMVAFSDPTALLDHERRVDEYDAASRNNFDVMNGYSGASEYNTTNLPTSYGALSADHSGLGVAPPATTIDSADSADSAGGSAAGSAAGGGSGTWGGGAQVAHTYERPVAGGFGSPGLGSPGSDDGANYPPPHGTTTPEGYVPGPGGAGVPPADPGPNRVPAASAGGPVHGMGPVMAGPGGGGGTGGSPRGGFGGGTGGTPRGGALGGGAGPRGGAMPGTGVGAEPHGSTARTGPVGGPVAAGGRGLAGTGGFPMGAAGRGRDGEDTEHKRPEWLEGGDPDELFDTDILTAPPTIGDEDD